MYTDTKMVGRRSEYSVEIRAYIKNCCILGIGCKTIFGEICSIYGHNEMSFPTAFRWFKKFQAGSVSTEDASHCRRPKTATSAKMVAKVKQIVTSDARYTTRQIASMVGISFGAAHAILKHNLKMRKICARWIPHLSTNEQKGHACKARKCC